jgi:hypothetical protein
LCQHIIPSNKCEIEEAARSVEIESGRDPAGCGIGSKKAESTIPHLYFDSALRAMQKIDIVKRCPLSALPPLYSSETVLSITTL